jgi:hypothetical protein
VRLDAEEGSRMQIEGYSGEWWVWWKVRTGEYVCAGYELPLLPEYHRLVDKEGLFRLVGFALTGVEWCL